MRGTLAIIGAGVMGQHIAHYAIMNGSFRNIVFFDDTFAIGSENQYGKIIGGLSSTEELIKKHKIGHMLIGVGYKHMQTRKSLFEKYRSQIDFPNIIHSSCLIDSKIIIGQGNVILPGCIVDKGCCIGNNNFFNPGCIISHDNVICDHNYFGPGIKTSGFVSIGSCCFAGTGTIIIDEISVGESIIIGAGSTITQSLTKKGTYAGTPARLIK